MVEPESATTGQTSAPTLADRLRELATLHQEGILSDEEFASAKAKLLSGL
ncbi:SHOCT domain-containing protein [Nocardioides bigeumensis]